MGGMDQNPYESPRVADKPAAAPIHFRLRTLLIGLLGLGAPVVCGIACITTLVEFYDYPSAYLWMAAPFVPTGIAGYLSHRSRWASAYWLAVAVGIATFVYMALFGDELSPPMFSARTGPRSEPATGMGVGIVGFAEWVMVAAAIPIGFAIWLLTRDRRQAQVATLNRP